MTMIMLLLSVSMCLFFIFNHPLPLVITLIFQTLVIIMNLYTNSETPWLSFITFLIYLGGLLIIFVYLSALVPNEVIYLNNYMYVWICAPSMIWLLTENIITKTPMEIVNNFSFHHNLSSAIFFLFYIMMMLCLLMFLCSSFKSPLKQNNY